jgi:hypothetical protein
MSLEEDFDSEAVDYDLDAVLDGCETKFEGIMEHFGLKDDQVLSLSAVIAKLFYVNRMFVNHGRFYFGTNQGLN